MLYKGGVTLRMKINFYHRYINNTKIVNKFLSIIVFILLVSIVIVNFYIKQNASSLITQEAKNTTKQLLEQYVDNINYKLTTFNTTLSSLSSNMNIKNILDNENLTETDLDHINQEFQQVLNNQFPYGLYSISLYPLGYAEHLESSFIKSIKTADANWLPYFKDNYYGKYFIHNEGTFDVKLLTVLKPIYSINGDYITAVIKLSLFPEKVFRSIKSVEHQSMDRLFIINKNSDYIYGNTFTDTNQYLTYLKENYQYLYSGTNVLDYQTTNGCYITSLASTNGYRAVYYFSYEDTAESLQSLNHTITVFILILILLICIAASLISISIGKRMQMVINKVNEVSRGNLELEKSDLGKDEIGIFDRTFSNMVIQLKKLIEDNYISEMKKKDAQFMALQAQINPHFLFNSLEVVNSLIETEKSDIAMIVNSKLSDLLRYCINHSSAGIVSVQEEIDYMCNYVYIQQIRFRDKFTFHIDIDENCLNFRIIKLVFQPFIENSINHGFAGKSNRNIWFSVQMSSSQNDIEIRIKDDGNGLTIDKLNYLRNELEVKPLFDFKSKNDSIGILNIHHRMKLKYGDQYRINIDSAPEKGMCIMLTIPAQTI